MLKLSSANAFDWTRLKFCPSDLIFYYAVFIRPFPKQALGFTCLQYTSFEKTVGKGEIARNSI